MKYNKAVYKAAKQICSDYGIDGNSPEDDLREIECVAALIEEHAAPSALFHELRSMLRIVENEFPKNNRLFVKISQARKLVDELSA